jgi:hypothetical protein
VPCASLITPQSGTLAEKDLRTDFCLLVGRYFRRSRRSRTQIGSSVVSENPESTKTVIPTHLTVRINSDPNRFMDRNARKSMTFFLTKDGNPFAI